MPKPKKVKENPNNPFKSPKMGNPVKTKSEPLMEHVEDRDLDMLKRLRRQGK